MKTIKKLTLKKETVASLESNEMNSLRGGATTDPASLEYNCWSKAPTACPTPSKNVHGYLVGDSCYCPQPQSQKYDKYGRKIC